MASSIFPIKTFQFKNGQMASTEDVVVVEEPLEIRLGFGDILDRKEESVVITMRTPGNDFDLAAGFLYCEGIIHSVEEIASIKYCYTSTGDQEEDNVVRVELVPGVEVDLKKTERHGFSHSGCGICGLTSIDSAFKLTSKKMVKGDVKVNADIINSLSDKALRLQHNFKYTGGIHSASLFSEKGELLGIMEDVGRHNALDKLIGTRLLKGSAFKEDQLLFLSGRMGFELVQKAAMAGICVIISVGAPSSLAIQLGMKMKMTLIGFTKKDKFNVYCGSERLSYD